MQKRARRRHSPQSQQQPTVSLKPSQIAVNQPAAAAAAAATVELVALHEEAPVEERKEEEAARPSLRLHAETRRQAQQEQQSQLDLGAAVLEVKEERDNSKDEGLPPSRHLSELLERGEKLDQIVLSQSDLLEEQAFRFRLKAAKRPGFFARLFSKDKAKAKKKKPKTKIDTILADIENVFNGLSAVLRKVTDWPRPGWPWLLDAGWAVLFLLPLLVFTYVGVSLFTLAVLLPAVFLLLVLRTQHIERKVDTGFVQRQQVLAQETVQEKRFVN
jgi:hypothetical protein